MTSDLTWKHYIGLITGKAQKILNLLRRNLYGCNPDAKKRAFTSLVLPHLEYTSTVWEPYHKQDIQALEKVQRKGARSACPQVFSSGGTCTLLPSISNSSFGGTKKINCIFSTQGRAPCCFL